MSTLEIINKEINKEISDETVQKALLATTFKGLNFISMKQAMLEGMMRGFTFDDFLKKNVYAIPYKDYKTGKDGYSLITSIDYARKIGMRSGVVGKSAPTFTQDEKGNVESCSITIKRKVDEYIGEYSTTVYFSEYTTNKNLWTSKPRTMLAKVAEMHALRMACPEELAKAYIEEEVEKTEVLKLEAEVPVDEYKAKLEACVTETELKKVWSATPIKAKKALKPLLDELKKKYADA